MFSLSVKNSDVSWRFRGDRICWNLLSWQMRQVVQINWFFRDQLYLHHYVSDVRDGADLWNSGKFEQSDSAVSPKRF